MKQLDNHTRIALQFSGGKDSLACLFFMRPYWDRLTVYWVNSGAAFPETVILMKKVRNLVPRFVEIHSSQPLDIIKNGYPVDVLPIRNLPVIMQFTGSRDIKLQPFFECCFRNLMTPMQERMKADGITLIVRGQRNDEKHKSTVRSGDVIDGFEFLFPIQDWTGEEVRNFVKLQEIGLPKNYEEMDTSLDCWDCTGYLEENIGKRRYMKREHPEMYRVVSDRLSMIAMETERDMKYLRQAMEI